MMMTWSKTIVMRKKAKNNSSEAMSKNNLDNYAPDYVKI